MCSNLSRCGSTVLDVLVPLFKRSVRKTYLFRVQTCSLISLFHPLSFLLSVHTMNSRWKSAAIVFSFFFFPFSFLPSFLPLPLSPLCPSSSVVVFPRDGSKMEAFVGARIKETRLFFFFFLEIYALTRQCKLSFPGADREISSPRFFECLGLHKGVGVAQLRVKLAKWLMHDEGCSS